MKSSYDVTDLPAFVILRASKSTVRNYKVFSSLNAHCLLGKRRGQTQQGTTANALLLWRAKSTMASAA